MCIRDSTETLQPAAPVEIIWEPKIFLPFHPNGMKFVSLDSEGTEMCIRDRIDTYFPIVTELLPIAEQCREVGFTEELTRQIVTLQPVEFKLSLIHI